jgi:TolB-like protein/DNA-binding SARP family transcriptional activator
LPRLVHLIQLHTLGALNLQKDGVEVRSVLSQPKRLALLVFLATARPRGFHSRDTLLGLCWPESDDAAARNALRQALHYLRRSLGEEAITSRSDRDVGIDPAVVWCDAAAFDTAIEEKRYRDALELYQGDFLPGFFLEEAPEIERWLDEERTRRRNAAVDAAWAAAKAEEQSGHLRAAAVWARKAVGLKPYDEDAVRRLITLLDQAGERAAAIEAFEDFERRLLTEFSITPSRETIQQIDAIRKPQAPHAPALIAPRPEPKQLPAAPAPLPAPARARATASPSRAVPARLVTVPYIRRWPRWLVAAVVVVVIASGAWFATRRPAASIDPEAARAIAVLPFDNMSGDAENEYFSDGLTEEILNALTQVDGLRVASRTSSFAFKDKKKDIREIGRQLGVTTVLEGSVRRSGDRVKITAQLINVQDGYHVWSKSYDREITQIFELQEEIAHAITDALALQFSVEEHERHVRRATKDAEAYDMYLRGKYLITIASQEQNLKAIELFGQATARDPRFALAYAGLARAHIASAEFVAPRQVLPRAKAAALRALQLDSTLVETRLALSEVRQVYDRDWLAAEYEIQRAISLDPGSADAHAAYANLLLDSRRYDEAKRERERAWELRALQTPDSTLNTFRVEREISWASYAWYASDREEAMRRARLAVTLNPSHPTARLMVAMLHIEMGQAQVAVQEMERIMALTQRATPYIAHLGRAYAAAGRTTDARALLDTLAVRGRTQYVGKDQVALLHYALGDTTAALDWLERAVEDYHWWMPNSNYHPLWRGLHEHPRFRDMMRKIGAP